MECKRAKADRERIVYCIKTAQKQTFYGCPYHYKRLKGGVYHWTALLNKEDIRTL
jgi:hypothetical protein